MVMIRVRLAGWFSLIFVACLSSLSHAGDTSGVNSGNSPAAADHSLTTGIGPGTRITMQNWRQYNQFMPDGMKELFEGKYFWKIPPDVELEVGPTVIHPLPTGYLKATEEGRAQTRIVTLPDGRLNVE